MAPRYLLLLLKDFDSSELVLSADNDDGGDESPDEEAVTKFLLVSNCLVSRD